METTLVTYFVNPSVGGLDPRAGLVKHHLVEDGTPLRLILVNMAIATGSPCPEQDWEKFTLFSFKLQRPFEAGELGISLDRAAHGSGFAVTLRRWYCPPHVICRPHENPEVVEEARHCEASDEEMNQFFAGLLNVDMANIPLRIARFGDQQVLGLIDWVTGDLAPHPQNGEDEVDAADV